MSTIIKASGPVRTMDGVTFNFDDMAVKANQYLDQVRADAAKILQRAEKEAQAIRTQAEEQGKQAALKAVERILDEKVGKQMATLLPAVRQAVEQLHQAKQAWLTHWEGRAVHVAAMIAERVMRRQLDRQPDITLALVKEALELASGSPELRIHLHPEDHATLGSQVERLSREIAPVGQATVLADPQITRGGCRVDTRFGTIDQQFQAQLARIEAELSGS
jgi:flagellar assembly protein FliH